MPATPAPSQAPTSTPAKPDAAPADTIDPNKPVRLHITPFNPTLLKVYVAPSILPLAQNISYHATETYPEKGFGYVELPAMEAQKLKKKLNGSTLKGSKVRIEEAKPEKRKVIEDENEAESSEKPAKRAKRVKAKKEQGVLEGVELENGRTVKRGWTEPATKKKKHDKTEKKEKKDKKEKRDKSAKKEQKPSKYTREAELLFNAKLTPVAATEKVHKEKNKDKKAKKEKNKNKKSTEVTIHEYEHNIKYPAFLKSAPVAQEDKEPVEYINGKGWVAADGTVVEPETARAKNRRLLEQVDPTPDAMRAKIDGIVKTDASSKATKSSPAKKSKKKTATPPPESSESEFDGDESSVVSSSSEDESEAEAESETESIPAVASPSAPQKAQTPTPEEKKEVHPLEALFKRAKPPALTSSFDANTTSTPPKGGLAPINTSFSFFDAESMDVDGDDTTMANAPETPFTQRDFEWRGQRSAAPTPDTAAIGRRFSFDWRKESVEAEDDDDLDEEEVEAGKRLSSNTKANAANSQLPGLTEENDEGEEETEFGKWFWENRGDNNRAWKKRRRDTLKAKRLRENKKLTGGGRVV